MMAQNVINNAQLMGALTQEDYSNLLSNLAKQATVYQTSADAAKASVTSGANQMVNLLSEQKDNQMQMSQLMQQQNYSDAQIDIDQKRENNARLMGYMKGKLTAAGMLDSAAGMDLIAAYSNGASHELEHMENSQTKTQEYFLSQQQDIANQFFTNSFSIERDANDKVVSINSNLMQNLTDLQGQATKSIIQKDKDMLAITNDANSSLLGIQTQKRQDIKDQATLQIQKLQAQQAIAVLSNNMYNQQFSQLNALGTYARNMGLPQSTIDAMNNRAMQLGQGGTTSGYATPAVRNNNPGNLRGPDGNFQQFPDMQTGFQAMMSDLQAKQTGNTKTGLNGNSTLQQMISVYAPTSDGNDPTSYANIVAKTLGVTPQTPIGQIDTKQLALAMAQHEDPNAYAMLTGQQGGAQQQSSTQGTISWANTPDKPNSMSANVPDPQMNNMTPTDIYQNALTFALTGKNNVGSGRGQNKVLAAGQAVTSKANQIAQAAGVTNLADLQKEYSINKKAMDTQVGYLTSVDRALSSAENIQSLANRVMQNAQALNKFDSTDANKGINYLVSKYGDATDLKTYQALENEVSNEYSQAFARGHASGVTDQVMSVAQSIIDPNLSANAIDGVVSALENAGGMIKQASIDEIRKIGTGSVGTDNVAKFYSYVYGSNGGVNGAQQQTSQQSSPSTQAQPSSSGNYEVGSYVQGPDGNTYKIIDSSGNIEKVQYGEISLP
jgi:hypothetical protein